MDSDKNGIFWASDGGFKSGRDPLGLQNSSVAIYSCLLPGMTNLTGHIRYYSLYCWLLNEYDQLIRGKKTGLHQYNFIRRAELAIAFIMKKCGNPNNEDINSVIGAKFISQNNYKEIAPGVYSLADGADYESKVRYWKFKSGAFGQYYLGSLLHFKLVIESDKCFYLDENGKQLADAVCQSVDYDVRNLFLNSILDGKIEDSDIIRLSPLRLDNIRENSEEWNYLNNLLTSADSDNSIMRCQSMILMLNDINKNVPIKDFVEHRFKQCDITDCNDAEFGWRFYYLSETLHYCIETVFCYLLVTIDKMKNPSINAFSDSTRSELIEKLSDVTVYDNVKEWIEYCQQDIISTLNDIKKQVKQKEFAEAASNSIILILRLYNEYVENKDLLSDFEKKHNLSNHRGIFCGGLLNYVNKYLSDKPENYVVSLIRQIMNEHTIVAIAKMGKTNPDLRKFIIEEGRLILVQLRFPNETTPRTSTLYNYLHDMKYLSHEDKLTAIADKFILGYGN